MRPSIILSFFVALAAGIALAATAAAAGPPLNGKIAFTSYATGESDIYVMNSHGGNKVNLTPEFGGNDFYPDWSPNGAKIAFTRSQLLGWFFVSDIIVVDADGTGATTLTDGTSENTLPAWSPDGAGIAFASTRGVDGNFEIYTMNADGTGVTALTETDYPTMNLDPAWSPDGTKVAFARNPLVFGASSDIYVVNVDGSGVTQLTNSAGGIGNIHPTWSPDGTRIAFGSDRDGDLEIYVMNADGSGQTNVTNNPAADSDPDWAPDGTSILFSSNRDGAGPTFYTLDVVEPNTVKAVTNSPAGADPDWQRWVR